MLFNGIVHRRFRKTYAEWIFLVILKEGCSRDVRGSIFTRPDTSQIENLDQTQPKSTQRNNV